MDENRPQTKIKREFDDSEEVTNYWRRYNLIMNGGFTTTSSAYLSLIRESLISLPLPDFRTLKRRIDEDLRNRGLYI